MVQQTVSWHMDHASMPYLINILNTWNILNTLNLPCSTVNYFSIKLWHIHTSLISTLFSCPLQWQGLPTTSKAVSGAWRTVMFLSLFQQAYKPSTETTTNLRILNVNHHLFIGTGKKNDTYCSYFKFQFKIM